MIKILKYLMLVSLLSSSMLYALPKEVQFDMLKIKLSKQLKTEDYKGVLETIDKIKNLNVNIPDSLVFIEGKALFKEGKASRSYAKFEEYINKTGKNGKYYKKALSYMIEAEEEQKKNSKWFSPTVKEVIWKKAKEICKENGGRVPTIDELKKVFSDCGGARYQERNKNNSDYQSCCKNKGFLTDGFYWSSTTTEDDEGSAWGMDFSDGYVRDFGKRYLYYVRCVRDGQ